MRKSNTITAADLNVLAVSPAEAGRLAGVGRTTIYHAISYYDAFNSRRVRQSELEALLARSQLEAMRLQLQPHFLFNSLHTVSSLVKRDPDSARRVLSDLSELLRYALDDRGSHVTPLREDVAFLEGYVAIQKARFRDELEVSFDIDPAARDVMVPRMLLQPLVENAIKHGMTPRRTTHVQVQARLATGDLNLIIRDDGPGFAPPAYGIDGIGIRNIRQRLAALYGSAATFDVRNPPSGGAEISITLPTDRPRPDSAALKEVAVGIA